MKLPAVLTVAIACVLAEPVSFAQENAARVQPRLAESELRRFSELTTTRADLSQLNTDRLWIYKDGQLEKVTATQATRQLTRDSLLIDRVAEKPVELENQDGLSRYRLPIAMSEVKRDPAGSGVLSVPTETGPTTEAPFFIDYVHRGSLQFDGRLRQFVGTIAVGLWEDPPTGERPIQKSYSLNLHTTDVNSVQPDRVRPRALNAFYDVTIAGSEVKPDGTLAIRTDFASDSFEVPLPPVRRPTLQVSLPSRNLLGLGLETVPVTVTAIDLVNPDGFTINLEVEPRGSFDDNGKVRLGADGQGTATLRSGGIGNATITTSDARFVVTQGNLTYRLPWDFLLAALVGGVVGSLIRRSSRDRVLASMLTGCAVGLVVAAAWFVGIRLLGVEPIAHSGEALVFVLSALGAIQGPALLKRLGKEKEAEANG